MIFSEYKGIKKITLPITDEELTSIEDGGISLICHYMPSIIGQHLSNARKIEYFYNYYLGNQDISDKKRPYKSDENNNNKIVENHAWSQVNSKVSLLLGDHRRFVKKDSQESDDIKFLDRFLTDSGFYTEDNALKEYIYATGIGVSITIPRQDIINKDGSYSEEYDKDTMAPFINKTVNPCENFVVYSASNQQELFCVSISKKIDFKTFKEKKIYQIWTRYNYWELDENYKSIGAAVPQPIHLLPITEHSTNNNRQGIVEINREAFNLINMTISTVLDAVIDSCNKVIVFQNVDVKDEEVQAMKESGAVVVESNSVAGKEGKVYSLEVIGNLNEVDKFTQQRIITAYDNVGVPLASQSVSSGGDTAQARMLGGGWQNAFNLIKKDISSLQRSDNKQLQLILEICKTVPGTKLNEISSSEIEIKYSINPNDNIMAKAQAAQYLYNINMPYKSILDATGIVLDTETIANQWQERDKEIKEQEKNEEEGENNADMKAQKGETQIVE